jgi:GNAT superfamily N-acetyltransferase
MPIESTLSFRPLPGPLPHKKLQAYRKDAGWSASSLNDNTPHHPLGTVQWVSVESGKQQVGIARLELAPPEFCCVADFIISSKYRGRGIGSWFLRHIEQYCSGYGIRRLLLQPERGTQAFYAAHAYHRDPVAPDFLKKDLNPFQRKLFMR